MEIWKWVNGYEDRYEISNFGNIRSYYMGRGAQKGIPAKMAKKLKGRGGQILTKISKPRKTQLNKYGYRYVHLMKNKITKQKLIHRLIAEAFIPNPDSSKSFVNHKNGIKNDNRIENLEWCTLKQNTQHALKNGLMPVGEKSYMAKLSNSQVQRIRLIREISPKMSYEKIGKLFGASFSTVHQICRHLSWKHI